MRLTSGGRRANRWLFARSCKRCPPGVVDIGMVSRSLKDNEKTCKLPIAKDGISAILTGTIQPKA